MKPGSRHIVTERLILTAPEAVDFEEMIALWSDPAMMQYLGPPLARGEIWARLLKYAGHWSFFGFGYWMIRRADDGRLVGEANLSYQYRGYPALPDDEIEGGWVLSPVAQGQGYAGEALTALLGWADTTLGSPPIRCLIDPRNTASLRLADRQRFARAGRVTLAGSEVELLRRVADTQ